MRSQACLTRGCCLFAGGILGNSWRHGGLLLVHQQEGLRVLQSIEEQIESSQPQDQGEGLCRGRRLLRLLRPVPLRPGPVHPHPDGRHDQPLQCTERFLHRQGNHPVALGHQRVLGPAHLRFPLQGFQEKTDGRHLPLAASPGHHGVSHLHSDGDVTDCPKSQTVKFRNNTSCGRRTVLICVSVTRSMGRIDVRCGDHIAETNRKQVI